MTENFLAGIDELNHENPARDRARPDLLFLLLIGLFISLFVASCARKEPEQREWVGPQSTPSLASQAEKLITAEVTELASPVAPAEPALETPTPVPQHLELSQEIAETAISGVETYPLWGIEMHNMTFDGGLGLVAQAGTDWVRRNALLWSDVEPRQGDRNWSAVSKLEVEIGNIANEGIDLLLIIRRTPEWAQAYPGVYCGIMREDVIEDFADFMYDVVARYSAPPYNVKYWEIANEPDIDPSQVEADAVYGCLGDQNAANFGGSYYAKILRAVYPKVKAADPEAQLIVGGLLLDCDPNNPPRLTSTTGKEKDCSSARYLEGILKAGGGEYFDGVSFHAYDYYYGELGKYGNMNWQSEWNTTGPVLVAKSKYLQFTLFQYGYQDKYLINSEVALICGSTGEEAECNSDAFELTKAYYAAQAYAAALSENLVANIWYSVSGWRGSRIIGPNLSPKPVYDAYLFSASILKGLDYTRVLDIENQVSGFEFVSETSRVWMLWSLDGSVYSIDLPSEPDAVYDVFGTRKMAQQEITITVEPVYIVFTP